MVGIGHTAAGSASGAIRAVNVTAPGMQLVTFEGVEWTGLNQISFTLASETGEEGLAGVGLDDVAYDLVSAC